MNFRKIFFIILILIATLPEAFAFQIKNTDLKRINRSISLDGFLNRFSMKKCRTYRHDDVIFNITFDYLDQNSDNSLITFYFENEKFVKWSFDDRKEVVKQYLSEYCSQAFILYIPIIYDAIEQVMLEMPYRMFLKISNRINPVLFSEYSSVGTAQFASSSTVTSFSEDPPAFSRGFTMIKLNTSIADLNNIKAIKGLVAHEIAHKVLDHGSGNYERDFERKANRLIKKWGFKEDYEEASRIFGRAAVEKMKKCE